MLKAICKNVLWMAVPLSLAVGCATHEEPTTAQADYGPTPVLTPTSGEAETQIYSTDPTKLTATSSMDATPPGASDANWTVAEAIRTKLMSDPTMAPLGSDLITEVAKDGAVTLRGTVKTPGEKDRVRDAIASVPGVSSVNDDDLKVGTYHGKGTLDMNNPELQEH
jgi:hypothetical protein